jgi:CheY-like chemotaxis protein
MRVLFVEDDAMNRRVVSDMLAIVGLTMDEAEDAETGLRMVDQTSYQVVLMDLRMPGIDGLDAIRTIRARGDEKARIPIIVITADERADLKEACQEAGADAVLPKPVAMDTLFAALATTLPADGALPI